ncbi:MAG TPA: DUF3099 domain-containing protein [Microbacteriaceae bacterium]|nr:DUF3099 domain-containing protein [Microbacteriaceae bacterium]
MSKPQSITSLPLSPDDERKARMRKYTISMAIRMVCIIAMLFVTGPWLVLCALGAIFLPYFAVILANQVQSRPDASSVKVVSNAVVPRMSVSADEWISPTPQRDDA